MDVRTALNVRDKSQMKETLQAADPCARHALVRNAGQATAFADQVGFPLVAKPPDGAGAQSTFRLDDGDMLRGWLAAVPLGEDSPALLEEFLTGEEHTFDSVTVGGSTVWSSIADYRPPPLEVLRNPWIQWTVVLPRDITGPRYEGIHRWGPAALKALGVTDALTHMEWFARPDGSVAVSEVAARPPGAQLTSMHGYAHDFDLYRAWAELVILGRFDVPERRFAAGRPTCGAWGTGGCAQCTASTPSSSRSGTWSWRRDCRSRDSPRPATTWARGTRSCATRHRGGGGRAAPDRRRGPRRDGRGVRRGAIPPEMR